MTARTGVLVGGPDDGRTFPEFTTAETFGIRAACWRGGDTYYFAAETSETTFYLHPDIDPDVWSAARAAAA